MKYFGKPRIRIVKAYGTTWFAPVPQGDYGRMFPDEIIESFKLGKYLDVNLNMGIGGLWCFELKEKRKKFLGIL